MAGSLSSDGKSVNRKDKKADKCLRWKGPLQDALAMLLQANLKRNQLREATEIIEKKIRENEPWPGNAVTELQTTQK